MKTTTEMQLVPITKLVPYVNNARTHSPEQINKLRSSLREFGFINPVIIDRDYGVIAGHGRILAAKEEGITEVPCVFADHLTEAQKKAYIIADNRMAMDAGWDEELLRVEIESLQAADFDPLLTGFDEKELSKLFDDGIEAEEDDFDVDAELQKPTFTKSGDIWTLGRHRLMTIMAALAQQESESLSANIRLGIQFRNQQGKVQVNHNWFLGYTKDESGKLVIVPEEAEVVRRIYREYLEGASFVKIRRGLEADGILNGAKHARWHETNIKQILTNEKYIGDALLQKTYTVSVLDKKRSRNDGVMPKYYVEGCHEAIIDRETFLLVQEEIARRSSLYKGGKKRVYSSKYALTGNVICAHCGNIYRRVVWSVGNEKPVVWRCVSRLTTGQECSARTVPEEDLHAAIASAANMAYSNRDDIIPVLKENIENVVGCDVDDEIEVIDGMIRKSQMDLLDAGRDEALVQEIGERIVSLRERRQNVLTQAALRKDEIDRIKAMIGFIEEQTGEAEYSEILVRRMVEKVTIHDDRITVEFKSGLAIDVDA